MTNYIFEIQTSILGEVRSLNLASIRHCYDETGLCAHKIHSKLHSITPMGTKVYVILRKYIGLTWTCDNRELV